MISGIREVLTPEAWRKQGTAYRLNSAEQEPVRKRALEDLRFALFAFADANGGQFPKHDFTGDIPSRFSKIYCRTTVVMYNILHA